MAGAQLSAQFHSMEVSTGACETALQFKSKQIWKFAHVDVAQMSKSMLGMVRKAALASLK